MSEMSPIIEALEKQADALAALDCPRAAQTLRGLVAGLFGYDPSPTADEHYLRGFAAGDF